MAICICFKILSPGKFLDILEASQINCPSISMLHVTLSEFFVTSFVF